jgi:hypothetical protein
MYRIIPDKGNKLIYIELIGRLEMDDWRLFSQDMKVLSSQFNIKEFSILISLERMDTVSQECLPLCMEGLCNASKYADKIAFIHKRVMPRIQLNKILTFVNKRCNNATQTKLFTTKREAMTFLHT